MFSYMYVSHIWDGQIRYHIQNWANGEAMALLNLYGLFFFFSFFFSFSLFRAQLNGYVFIWSLNVAHARIPDIGRTPHREPAFTHYFMLKPICHCRICFSKCKWYCRVPARWGLQETTRAPDSDKTRGQGSYQKILKRNRPHIWPV